MKLKQGANEFRTLSAPILGYEYWTADRKPVKARELWNVIPIDADISGPKPQARTSKSRAAAKLKLYSGVVAKRGKTS